MSIAQYPDINAHLLVPRRRLVETTDVGPVGAAPIFAFQNIASLRRLTRYALLRNNFPEIRPKEGRRRP